MKIGVTGVNYKTAGVEEREATLKLLANLPGTLLATCNRVELYQSQKKEIYYLYQNKEAVKHLFRVVAGLDSQILGETEILGQVKDAYLRNMGKDSVLDKLFERAVQIGRRVREETGISRGNVSVASAAVAMAKYLLADNRSRKILLIGTGKVTESILKTLLKMNFNFIFVANRTFKKAFEIAQRIGGRAVGFESLSGELAESDLVISSTSAPHLIIRREQISKRQKPLVIFDLAVPRDVDPAISALPGVKLFNIDDIQEEININLLKRKIEAIFAEKILDQEVKKFCAEFGLVPAPAA
jgi:glutamyl-tRNA reductase